MSRVPRLEAALGKLVQLPVQLKSSQVMSSTQPHRKPLAKNRSTRHGSMTPLPRFDS